MSFTKQILVGLALGIVTGLFLGDMVGPLTVIADGFVKLLQMTVLPYVTISIVSSLGGLSYEDAKRLGLRSALVLLTLWAIGITYAFLVPLAFPATETASFFSTTLVARTAPLDFVELYIPSNPFHSLANNIVPAVVLFSVIVGVAMIGVERKRVVLDVLVVAGQALARATRSIVRLTPVGIFAIAASAAGTLDLQQLERLQVYLLAYMAVAALVALWVLPGLVAAVTPFRYSEVISSLARCVDHRLHGGRSVHRASNPGCRLREGHRQPRTVRQRVDVAAGLAHPDVVQLSCTRESSCR